MQRTLKRLQQPHNGIQYITSVATMEELDPFVFFDAGLMHRQDDGMRIGTHPHSGIGIITYFEGGELVHDDSGRNDATIKDGGVQWIRAGGGIWHMEHSKKKADEKAAPWPLAIHQLWLQLPPELEEGETEYQNIQPEDLPMVDNVKVIAGAYREVESPLKVPFELTYLDVKLAAGEIFEMQTIAEQSTGFVFPRIGEIELHGQPIPLGPLGVLQQGGGELSIQAQGDAAFVVATAVPQGLPKVVRGGSIHSNEGAMQRSLQRIEQIGGRS
ncbi:MAG: hypothetical protein GKR89_09780 [Candidatus Latescibacteria bacterium]|nr:hypothetical protein [Candidatus Latescibacterota bacterium]